MNKKELIREVSKKTGVKKAETEVMLDAVLDTILETLLTGDDVKIVDFGVFETKTRAARKMVNPQNPTEYLDVKESTTVKFRPYSAMKAKFEKY